MFTKFHAKVHNKAFLKLRLTTTLTTMQSYAGISHNKMDEQAYIYAYMLCMVYNFRAIVNVYVVC